MKNIFVILALFCIVLLLSACQPQANNKEIIKPNNNSEESQIQPEDSIQNEKLDENSLETSGEEDSSEIIANTPKKIRENVEGKKNVYEWISEAEEFFNIERPQYKAFSNLFNSEVRVGTKENPIKVGEVGLASSLDTYDGDEFGTYGHDIYIKFTGRMTDEEVEEFLNDYYASNPNKTRNENFVFIGANFEVDFNDDPDLADFIKLGMDKRLDSLPVLNIDSKKFNALNGNILKATIDDDNIEDNHFQVVFSQFKEKDEHPLIKITCIKGDMEFPDDYFYCFYEI